MFSPPSKLKALPPIIFYENHYEGITYKTIIELLPALKALGYGRILFEPIFLFNNDEEERAEYYSKSWFLRKHNYWRGFNHVCLFEEAKQLKMSVESNDLPRSIFIQKITHFINIYKFSTNQQWENLYQEPIEELKTQLKELLTTNYRGFTSLRERMEAQIALFAVSIHCTAYAEAMATNFLNEMMAFLAVQNKYKNNAEAQQFFTERTNNMANLANLYSKEGVIVICGYGHICHPNIHNGLAYHLTCSEAFVQKGQFEQAAPLALEDTGTHIIVAKDGHAIRFLNHLKNKLKNDSCEIANAHIELLDNRKNSWCPNF